MLLSWCVTYLQQLVKDKRAFIGDSAILHNNQGGSSTVKEDNINISQTWIVSHIRVSTILGINIVVMCLV